MLRENTPTISERAITSQSAESSEWTVRAVQPFSTVSCTNCPTTGQYIAIYLQMSAHNYFHRFGELKMDYRSPAGYDRTRNAVIGHKDFDLTYLEEAFTSEHWLVRVYR